MVKRIRHAAKVRKTRILEPLEARRYLAGDLVAHWLANDLTAGLESGARVAEWSDSVGMVNAQSTGDPILISDGIGGRAAVRFNATDGGDSLIVSSSSSPMSGADDFSVVVAFATSSNQLPDAAKDWFEGINLAHSNRLGFAADWGITLNADGRAGAGMGVGFAQASTSVFSTVTGLNDGQLHVATLSRAADRLSLYVDDHSGVEVSGADSAPRGELEMLIGGPPGGSNVFTGDIAEVRIYDGSLTPQEVNALHGEITSFYNNAIPTASDDTYSLEEDNFFFAVPAERGLLVNDTDAEGDTLTALVVEEPRRGTLALKPDGSFIYQPEENFFGVDSFTYVASDSRSSNVATVMLEVAPSYDAAVGVADQFKTRPDQLLRIPYIVGVLANDINLDDLPLTVELVEDVPFGSLELKPDGSFEFDPGGNAGTITFSYRINDTVGFSAPVTATLIVNTAPVARHDRYESFEDSVLQVAAGDGLLANDRDADGNSLELIVLSKPDRGELELFPDGSFSYLPESNFFGKVRFNYRLSDGIDNSNIAEVSLEIQPVNDPPVTQDDAYYVMSNRRLTVSAERSVLRNDSDIEGSELSAVLVEGPSQGAVEFLSDGTFQFDPDVDFVGEDSFTYRISDGQNSTAEGKVRLFVGVSPVHISEFMAANGTTLRTRTRETVSDRFSRGEVYMPDWIELQNLTNLELDISGFHLTDEEDNPTKWQVPNGTKISAGGFQLFFATGLDIRDLELDEKSVLHTNFKLDAEQGEYLALTDPSGSMLYEFAPAYPRQTADVSYGLTDDGLRYLPSPSPGEASVSVGLTGIVAGTTTSVPAGFYQEPISVEIFTEANDSVIRYTLDGSEPTLGEEDGSSRDYTQAIQIDTTTTLRTRVFRGGLVPSTAQTYSYLYLDDVLRQPSNPAGFPPTWGLAGSADYAMDSRVAVDTESPYYNPNVRDALQSHAAISIVTDLDHLFDRTDGIYSNPQREGVAWERPVSMELFTSEGQQQLQVNAGLRIQGGASRNPNRPKHNMRLLFKERYGVSKLDFPLFEHGDVDRFDTLILRGGNGDSWFHPSATQQLQAQYIRDQWHRETQRLTGNLHVAQRHFHLYVNGLYWGFYHVFEKPNASFFAERFGGEPEDYDVLQHKNSTVDGNRDAWNEMIKIVRTDSESPETFESVQQYIDLEGLADYLLINFYSGNVDWDQNNWFGGRKRAPGEQFKFFTWDAERSFLTNVNENRTGLVNTNQPSFFHQRMARNLEYRMLFADRAHRLLFNEGLLTPERVEQTWMQFADEIELPLAAESARWGDNKRPNRPYSTDSEWTRELNRLKDSWFPRRSEILISQLQQRNMYPEVVAPVFNQHGGLIDEAFQLQMNADAGTILYTIDGSDPRVAGGDVAPGALTFEGPIIISDDTLVRARVLLDGEWSALNEAQFLGSSVSADGQTLRLTEVHYNPAVSTQAELDADYDNNDDFEFIELLNVSQQTIDLTNVRLLKTIDGDQEEGVAFDFSNGDITRLATGQRLVVVENVDAFRFRYGEDPTIAGSWSGRLSNGGEQITLVAGEEVIHQFSYDDEWYPTTDGDGASLEVIDARAELDSWSQSSSWSASAMIGGTPGAAPQLDIAGDSNGDGIFDSKDLVLVLQIGEYEDGVVGNSTFEEGDWNRDGDFDTRDFVYVFQQGTYAPAVPPQARLFSSPMWMIDETDALDRMHAQRTKIDFIELDHEEIQRRRSLALSLSLHDDDYTSIERPIPNQDAAFDQVFAEHLDDAAELVSLTHERV